MLKRLLITAALVSSPALADITPEADACIEELRSQVGDIGGEVLGQEFSQAATVVKLRDANGVEYECIVWSGPEVADFRRVGGAAAGSNFDADVVSGTQRVQFDAGTSGKVMSATLAPNSSVRYALGAQNEQFLNVDIGSHGGAVDYRILNPDGTELLSLIGSDTPYEGQLWQSGDHVIEVVNAGAQPVTFDIGIGIR